MINKKQVLLHLTLLIYRIVYGEPMALLSATGKSIGKSQAKVAKVPGWY